MQERLQFCQASQHCTIASDAAASMLQVTLGRNDAVMNFNGWSIPWFIPRYVKSGDLLISQTRKDLGLPKAALPVAQPIQPVPLYA